MFKGKIKLKLTHSSVLYGLVFHPKNKWKKESLLFFMTYPLPNNKFCLTFSWAIYMTEEDTIIICSMLCMYSHFTFYSLKNQGHSILSRIRQQYVLFLNVDRIFYWLLEFYVFIFWVNIETLSNLKNLIIAWNV